MTARTRGLNVGIDIGGSKILGVALDEHSNVVATTRFASNSGATGVVDSAIHCVHQLATTAGVSRAAFESVGVGVPGLVQPRSGRVSHAVNLGVGAGAVDLGVRLEQALGMPVTVENDVNAAALGAAKVLALGDADLAYLSIGTGLAAGLLIQGRLRRGVRGGAGEIGHIPVDPAGALCACGQRGCLETVASGSSIAAAWPGDATRTPAASLFAAAAAGDARAVAIRDRFADAVAGAVRLLVLTYDVEVVVLGGGVTDLGAPLLEAVCDALKRQGVRSPFLRSLDLPHRVAIVPAGSPLAAVGAALAGLRQPR